MSNLQESIHHALAISRPSLLSLRGARRPASAIAWRANLAITSSHALGRASSVTLIDDTSGEHPARILGRDPGLDVAVLALESDALTPAEQAPLAQVALGQIVLALGRPGEEVRLSLRAVGLFKAAGVDLPGGGRLAAYLETDRGIPTGFSGGPLVNLDGKLLGMSSPHVLAGADLAVVNEDIASVVAQLDEHGAVARGYLGVMVQRGYLPRALADNLGRRAGAVITGVRRESPAEEAGLLLGDVILELDGKAVSNARELRAAIALRSQQEITGRVLRAGQIEERNITIGQRAPQ